MKRKRHYYEGWHAHCSCWQHRIQRKVNLAIAVFLAFAGAYFGLHALAYLVKGM